MVMASHPDFHAYVRMFTAPFFVRIVLQVIRVKTHLVAATIDVSEVGSFFGVDAIEVQMGTFLGSRTQKIQSKDGGQKGGKGCVSVGLKAFGVTFT